MKKKEMTIDKLAGMVERHFEKLEQGQEKLQGDVTELKQGQEGIKLRLDNVAYRFELKALEKRVERYEHELRLAKS